SAERLRSPSEIAAQERRRLLFEDAAVHRGVVVEPGVAQEVPQGTRGPRLGLPRAEDDFAHPGEHRRARAHRARFQGHHEGAVFEPPAVAVAGGGLAEGEDLGVGGGVGEGFAPVRRGRELAAVGTVDDGADREVVPGVRRSLQGTAHAAFVDLASGVPHRGRGAQATLTDSRASVKPRTSATSEITSEGIMPSLAHNASRVAPGTPRSPRRSASPTGSASSSVGRALIDSSSSVSISPVSSGSRSPNSASPRRDCEAYSASEPNVRRSSPLSRRITVRYSSSASTKSSVRSASG